MRQSISAISMLMGTIIGVGMFGLPYAAGKVGFLPVVFIYFPILGLIILIIHLIYGEICLRTDGIHRLPGYSKIYLGKIGEIIAIITDIIGFLGAMLAFLILGGQFLTNLLMPLIGGNGLTYILIFFTSAALIIFTETKGIAKAEFIGLIILFSALFYLVIKGLPHIQLANLQTYKLTDLFLPYGVILFSLGGLSVIPELEDILGQNTKKLKNIIIAGTLIPIFIYLIFIYLVLGVNGSLVTQDALTGLRQALGQKVIMAGLIIGIVTTFTSYLSIGQTLKKIFWHDLKFSHFNAWVIACFIPLILYFAGFQNFIKIISFVGAIAVAAGGILIFLIYIKAKKIGKVKPAYELKVPNLICYLVITMFIVGALIGLMNI